MNLESLEVSSSLGLFFESTLGDVSVYLGLTTRLVQVLIRWVWGEAQDYLLLRRMSGLHNIIHHKVLIYKRKMKSK